jgi:hypothetical protein
LVWTSNHTQEEFNRDDYECLRDARFMDTYSVGGELYSNRVTDWRQYYQCMGARGYRLTTLPR